MTKSPVSAMDREALEERARERIKDVVDHVERAYLGNSKVADALRLVKNRLLNELPAIFGSLPPGVVRKAQYDWRRHENRLECREHRNEPYKDEGWTPALTSDAQEVVDMLYPDLRMR